MNDSCEKDLLGFVLGALDAPEQRQIQEAIDNDTHLEDQLLAIKHAIAPLDYLDNAGPPPGLARRTVEFVANVGQPPLRPFNPQSPNLQGRNSPGQFGESSQRYQVLLAALLGSEIPPTKTDATPPPITGNKPGSNEADADRAPNLTSPQQTPRTQLFNDVSHATEFATGNPAEEPPVFTSPTSFGDKQITYSSVSTAGTPTDGSIGFSPPIEMSSVGFERAVRRSPFSFADLAVCVACLGILAGILFPAISYSRYQTRLVHCQNNLREIGDSMYKYSEANGGRFVSIPRSGPLAVVGAFAPILKDGGFVEQDELFGCAGVSGRSKGVPIRIPSLATIEKAVGEQLLQLQQSFSGHYGYTMGHCSTNGYAPPKNLGRSFVALVSDSPAVSRADRISLNHDSRGQNCLFEDGRVDFIAGDTYGGDAIFYNDYHLVAPGCRAGDNVIAPSHLSPIFAANHFPGWN